MVMSHDEKKQIEQNLSNTEKFLLAKLSGDRNAHAIQFQNINGVLADIKLLLKEHIKDEIQGREGYAKIQLKHIGELKAGIEEAKTSIRDYKKKMYLFEIFMNFKRVPFYIVTAIFVNRFKEELVVVYDFFTNKLTGL